MRHPVPRLGPVCLLLACATLPAADDGGDADGAELVRRLADPARAQRAHYALWARARPGDDKGWRAFAAEHYGQRVLLCPQPGGAAPITLVLYGFLTPYRRPGDYPVDDIDALFPGEPVDGSTAAFDGVPAIDAYAADGTQLDPFAGNTVLDHGEALADLDGDGQIERVSDVHYGLPDGTNAEVVCIQRVRPVAEPLCTVLIDWKADDWVVETLRPVDGAPGEVRMGPRGEDGTLRPRAVLRPGADGAWALAPGWPTDHVVRLAGIDVWQELLAQRAAGLVFAGDGAPSTVVAAPPTAEPAASGNTVLAVRQAYAFRSLGRDPAVVSAFMAPGRSVRDIEAEARQPDAIPEDFWRLPPRAAALALAEANRSPAHRARFRLAVDDRDGAVPPAVGVLDVGIASSRCYSDRRQAWRLRCEGDRSELTVAWTQRGGVVFRDPLAVRPRAGIASAAVEAAVAQHALAVVWWLDRVRSYDRHPDRSLGGMHSTADGRGLLRLSDAAGVVLCERSTRLWSGSVPERWRDDYDHETMLNLTRLVLLRGVAAHAGLQAGSGDRVDEAALHTGVRQVLARPDRYGHAIVLTAVQAAGDRAWDDCGMDIRRIRDALPDDLPPLRTDGQIRAEIDATPAASAERRSQLYAELFALDLRRAGSPQELAAEAGAVLERLRLAGDPAALAVAAAGSDANADWALARLCVADRPAYVAALERRLQAADGPARGLFAAIAAADPARAAELAAAAPIAGRDAIDRAEAVRDPQLRCAAALRVLGDPASGWDGRGRAIALLVPAGDPLRFPAPEIDAALVRALVPDADASGSLFTAATASAALADRGRVEHLGTMLGLLQPEADSWSRGRILAAALRLMPAAASADRAALEAWTAAQLRRTSMRITDILWAAWVLDLRRSASDVEAAATAGPRDAEGPMATSYGGAPRSPASDGYHLARRIAQLWREDDPAARALLLLALAEDRSSDALTESVRRHSDAALAALAGQPGVHDAAAAWCRMRAAAMDPCADPRLAADLQRLGVDPAREAP